LGVYEEFACEGEIDTILPLLRKGRELINDTQTYLIYKYYEKNMKNIDMNTINNINMLTVHRRNLFPNLLLGELPIPWFSGEVDIKHTLHKFYTLAGHCVDDLLRKRGENIILTRLIYKCFDLRFDSGQWTERFIYNLIT